MKKPLNYVFGILLILFDQMTKLWAKGSLKGNSDISIIENVFCLHYLENHGAAFGIFQNQQLFFLITTAIILAGIGYFSYKLPQDKKYLPLEIISLFVSAGAIGNFIDRLSYGYVIDFLYFELIDFPVFNVADCYVTCSAFFLIILIFFYYKEEDFAFLNRKEA